MNILFIHNNFPGQYKHLVNALVRDKQHNVAFVTTQADVEIAGVRKFLVDIKSINDKGREDIHRYLRKYQTLIYRSEIFYRAFRFVQEKGFYPDVIALHPGWGVGLFVRDAFPNTPILTYQEYFRLPHIEALETFPPQLRDPEASKYWRIHMSRSLNHLVWTDWSITPMYWQRNSFPDVFHPRISVLHEGIDTNALSHDAVPLKPLKFSNGISLNPDDEIVTYATRNQEPVRGFPTVIKAIQLIQKQRPHCHFILLGGSGSGYSSYVPPDGKTWQEYMFDEVKVDRSKIHTPGYIDYKAYLGVLRASKVHIYLTTGFVLSWSFLEAMSLGCLIVGSKTPPVQEVMQNGKNGLLVDFNDHEALADNVIQALEKQKEMQELRIQARQTIIQGYALKDILPLQLDLLKDLARGDIPPPTASRIIKRNEMLGLSTKLR